jgi:PadR family transcriptional regulator, regulatory protein AphA
MYLCDISCRYMELSPTAYVILGMLSWRPMSGYDIKATVDKSTRFFWAASYGQIYPELHRLAEAGLVEAEPEAGSGRRRTLFTLTDEGRRALRGWLAQKPETYESRDEGLLKLFFADAAPETAQDTLATMRGHHSETVERLRAIQAREQPTGFSFLVLRYGIECHEWMAGWCEREAKRL